MMIEERELTPEEVAVLRDHADQSSRTWINPPPEPNEGDGTTDERTYVVIALGWRNERTSN
jgi:hypothetical protein